MTLTWRRRERSEKPASRQLTDDETQLLTNARRRWAINSSFFFFVSFLFSVFVQIGNTHNKNVLKDWFLFKIDIADIAITSYSGGIAFSNSLAQTVGLHDYYQVGLWSFCEGYDNGQGTVYCSDPKFGYWFNPVGIIFSELFAGATIQLPEEIYTYLNIIQMASHAMFGTLFVGTIFAFLAIFLTYFSIRSRPLSIVIGIFSLLTALLITVGAVISTAMWAIFTHVINEQAGELGIKPITGRAMQAFQWIAAAAAIIAAVIQLAMTCCCTSRWYAKHSDKINTIMEKTERQKEKRRAEREAEESNGTPDSSQSHPEHGRTERWLQEVHEGNAERV